jgi:hypothetical protein
MIAQGNALGIRLSWEHFALKGQNREPDDAVSPFQGLGVLWLPGAQGVALGCPAWPLRGKILGLI